MPPQLLFGTATFGMDGTTFQSAETIHPLLTVLRTQGIHRLDTGARYPPMNPGRTEQLIGSANNPALELAIDTKVLTSTPDGSGDLTQPRVRESVNASLERLRVQKVNILYAHRADHATDLVEQVNAFNEQITLGHCDAWGVSNYSLPHLQATLDVCDKHGLKKPSVYQGHYNALTRAMEKELLPLLREHGMNFIAYSPVAAGILTGNVANGAVEGTRFDSKINPLASHLQQAWNVASMNEAVRNFVDICAANGMTPIEAALRWVYWHSPLDDGDGIILGASKISQIEQNCASVRKGQLSDNVVTACETLWQSVEGERGGIF